MTQSGNCASLRFSFRGFRASMSERRFFTRWGQRRMKIRVAGMNRRLLLCPECRRQISFKSVKLGSCPFCGTKICIPRSYGRPAAVIGATAVLIFVIETYRIMLAPSPSTVSNFVLFLLWFVVMFAIFFSATTLSSFVFVWLFPPVVRRAYANDMFTTLRLGD